MRTWGQRSRLTHASNGFRDTSSSNTPRRALNLVPTSRVDTYPVKRGEPGKKPCSCGGRPESSAGSEPALREVLARLPAVVLTEIEKVEKGPPGPREMKGVDPEKGGSLIVRFE